MKGHWETGTRSPQHSAAIGIRYSDRLGDLVHEYHESRHDS